MQTQAWRMAVRGLAAIGALVLLSLPTGATSLLFDVANGVTLGSFTVRDVTADIETTFFNPAISMEMRFGTADVFSFGVGYGKMENDFTGDWSGDEGKHIEGKVTVEREVLDVFIRLTSGPNFNIRFGIRTFQLDFSDGYLEKSEDGVITEIAENAHAKGKLKTGLDGELNFVGGERFQFRFCLGLSYFRDADYDWRYDRTLFDPESHDSNEGTAKQDAVSLRLKPEFTFEVIKNLRVTLDYTLMASAWKGDTDQADIEDFVGVDVSSAVNVGLEYVLPF